MWRHNYDNRGMDYEDDDYDDNYGDERGVSHFNGYYNDLKRVMEQTLTPRLPTPPPFTSSSSTTASPDDTTATTGSASDELSLSLDLRGGPTPGLGSLTLPELRSHRLGERPLPTPRTPRASDVVPPSPRGFVTPRTPRFNNYPPSPRSRSSSPRKSSRSRSNSPPKSARTRSNSPPKSARSLSFGAPRTPRRTPRLEDLGYVDYHQGPRSRRSSPGYPRTPPSVRASSRKSVDGPYPQVVAPPPYSDAPLASSRSRMSDKYVFGDDGMRDGGGVSADADMDGVSFLYPEDVKRMLSRDSLSPPNDDSGWSRREKLLLVLLLFAIVTVVVLFLVIFLVMSGILGSKTEIYNYGQQQSSQSNTSPSLPGPNPTVLPPITATGTPGAGTLSTSGFSNTATITKPSLKTSTQPGVTQNLVVGTTTTSTTTARSRTVPSTLLTTLTTRTPQTVSRSTITAATRPTTTTTKATSKPSSPPTTASTRSPTKTTTVRVTQATARTTSVATPPPTTPPPTTTTTTRSTTTPTTTTTLPTTTTPPTTTSTTTTTAEPATTAAPLRCDTGRCANVAAAVQTSLNQSVGFGACSNFFQHACGKNLNTPTSQSTFAEEYSPLFNVVLEDLYSMSARALSQPVSAGATNGERAAKALYTTCKASNGILDTFTAIQEMYTLFGQLNFNTDVTSSLSIDVMQQTSLEEYGAGPLFTVKRVPVYDGKRYKYMTLISPPTLVLDPSLYDPSKPQRHIEGVETAYVATLVNILYSWFAVNIPDEPPSDLADNIEARLRQVIAFEKRLNQITPDSTTDWTRLYTERMTVSSLQQLTPSLSWRLILGKNNNDQVQVYYKDYLESLDILLQSTDQDVVKTYIFYHVIFNQAWRFGNRSLRETMMGFLPGLKIDYTDTDCAKLIYDVAFQDAKQVLLTSQKEAFTSMLVFPEAVTAGFKADLDNTLSGLSWLSDITRTFLRDQVTSLSTQAPDMSSDKETISSDYRPDVSSGYTLMRNAVNRLRVAVRQETTLDAMTVDTPEETRFEFSPLYSVTTDTLHFPVAFLHLGTWLRDSPEFLPLYQSLLASSVLRQLLHPEALKSWSDPTSVDLADRVECFSDNVVPNLPDNTDFDHLTNLMATAAAMEFVNKNETTDSISRQRFEIRGTTFSDDKQFRFYILAQGFCSGDVYSRWGEIAPGKPTPEKELNFAVANDQLFALAFTCEPGLPMAGESTCFLWEDTFYDYNSD